MSREMLDRLGDQEQLLAMVARDVYQNGQVLAHKKYRLLKYAYSIFILGLFASVAAFIATGDEGRSMSDAEPESDAETADRSRASRARRSRL